MKVVPTREILSSFGFFRCEASNHKVGMGERNFARLSLFDKHPICRDGIFLVLCLIVDPLLPCCFTPENPNEAMEGSQLLVSTSPMWKTVSCEA